jgi:preprotein translocase subunit YajC
VGSTQQVRGHIHQIDNDYFVIQPDGQTQTLQVPYNNILKVNKNLSLGAKIAIVGGIAAAVVLIVVLSVASRLE